MTFRSVQAALTSLLFLLCLNHLKDKNTAAVNIREKCMCITEAKSLSWRNVKNFRVIDSAPLCNKVQIIIYTVSRQVCLDPNSEQGKKLQKCWKRIKFNERKMKSCLKARHVRRRPKKPKAT
ncbi:hypothetical protein Q7C36_007863 [Tachysurus vachellii]|uniref:Chemokine interleukin-8-like domain-containing protein n=1 Tax=Tachysurus vachellii TaxID=175792 RepID=A0AA88T3G2_TACVA|nr:chemokine (C-X-C motif) ligand 18a, duplicate 1 [Tachysurus vachellii]KAK2852662.1 hypothetical protein Q7C36_007863 [Tachysurus vachellii]